MLYRFAIVALAALSFIPLSACAADKKPSPVTGAPAACQPGPCVTLNAQELNILGPIVGGRFQALQQEYQALGSVIQDIQRQTGNLPPQSPPAALPPPKK